ncbi:hypothetical protein RFI_10340 [Reticulomyxa filosa]|uniref:BTB domain-containing protein n=1 Tax=Reticulomyxa filosa TaxID=46433 RepID=X6NM47_RETFI|nr:hypothetical protein RFI_10340 [Reticulomyxa filosa]|eukprot:ETO26794.1 hypothetical protein RFI_10340 [Reticulomyxa filosa]
MLETTTKEVRMHEWNPSTVLAMVEFLYTCRIPPCPSVEVKRAIELCRGSLDFDDELSSAEFGFILKNLKRTQKQKRQFFCYYFVNYKFFGACNERGIIVAGSNEEGYLEKNDYSNDDRYEKEKKLIEDENDWMVSNVNINDFRGRIAASAQVEQNLSKRQVLDTSRHLQNIRNVKENGTSEQDKKVSAANEDNYSGDEDKGKQCSLIRKAKVIRCDPQYQENIHQKNQFVADIDVSDNLNTDHHRQCSNNIYENSTFKLFQLAEYYKLQSLLVACCDKMHQELTTQTACDLLIRIQRYGHVPEICAVQESIWKFVTTNIRDIKRSNSYENLVRHHSLLLAELVDKIIA